MNYNHIIVSMNPETLTEIDSFIATSDPGVAWGIDVANGNIYLTHGEASNYYISRYDASGTQTGQFPDSGITLNQPWDVVVKADSVYVINYEEPNSRHKIVQIDTGLTRVMGSIGSTANPPTKTGDVIFPTIFVAKKKPGVYILDDDLNDIEDRLLYMDNINGDGWNSLKPEDIGRNPFSFFMFSMAK